MPVAGHRVQATRLQTRGRLDIQGQVAQRETPRGIYADGWTDGELSLTVEPACAIESFTTIGVVPDWWPEASLITVEVNGVQQAEMPARPGRFELRCNVALPQEQRTCITVRTSTTVHDAQQNRYLGIYVGQMVFHGSAPIQQFRCNICSAGGNRFDAVLDPEGSVCRKCGSNIRLRALAMLIGDSVFGKTAALGDFPSSHASGIGISDSPRFAAHVARALPKYRNAQFDRTLVSAWAPYADVTNPPPELVGDADFITCSEVLEHVEPPVEAAFAGLFSMLRPGGTLILTVPYTLGETVEHFPDLNVWHLELNQGKRVLVNRTRSGEVQRFENLRFHGGGEDVLEMRVFGLQDIFSYLENAGFTDIRVREDNALEYGIFFKYNWGLPITAKRPA